MDSVLPFDSMLEILSRTSLETLHACMSTCKQFNSLVYKSFFLNRYARNTNIFSGYLLKNNYSFDKYKFLPSPLCNDVPIPQMWLPREAEILATSDVGIMVYVRKTFNGQYLERYHVCKPATRQVEEMPNPKTRYWTYHVVLVVVGSNPLRYKIIRLSEPNHKTLTNNVYLCEIFDSSTWAWKQSKDIILPTGDYIEYKTPIVTRGSLYFLLTNMQVLEYDTKTETYKIFDAPRVTFNKSRSYRMQLVKYEGGLGFTCDHTEKGCFELWTMKAWKDSRVWKRRHVINPPKSFNIIDLVGFCDSDTAIMHDSLKFVSYNFKNESFMNTRDFSFDEDEILAFRSDQERVNLKGR